MTVTAIETWRAVPGFEGLYDVSDRGRVRSRRRKGAKGGVLTPQVYEGYPRVMLSRFNRRQTRNVHLLVAAAFLGPRPEGQQVRHRNGDSLDPRLTNLAYGTPSENQHDAVRHGTHANAVKTHCPGNHEYTPENTYTRPDRPGRMCRECERARHRRRALQVA